MTNPSGFGSFEDLEAGKDKSVGTPFSAELFSPAALADWMAALPKSEDLLDGFAIVGEIKDTLPRKADGTLDADAAALHLRDIQVKLGIQAAADLVSNLPAKELAILNEALKELGQNRVFKMSVVDMKGRPCWQVASDGGTLQVPLDGTPAAYTGSDGRKLTGPAAVAEVDYKIRESLKAADIPDSPTERLTKALDLFGKSDPAALMLYLTSLQSKDAKAFEAVKTQLEKTFAHLNLKIEKVGELLHLKMASAGGNLDLPFSVDNRPGHQYGVDGDRKIVDRSDAFAVYAKMKGGAAPPAKPSEFPIPVSAKPRGKRGT